MLSISSFQGDYRFLSNFYPAVVRLTGPDGSSAPEYPTVEHAYQASKTNDETWRLTIRTALSPGDAKRLGRQVPLSPVFEAAKLDIMKGLLRQKFSHSLLRKRLIATGQAILIEGNTWHDNYWGQCSCSRCRGLIGENHLGVLLMHERERKS